MKEKEIKVDVVKLALAIQLAVLGLVGLSKIGIEIPIIMESVIFIYLVLIPGILILKTLGIDTNLTKILLLSVGISLSTVVLWLTFWNVILAPFYETPLSKLPVIISLASFTLLLTILCWYKTNHYYTFSFNLSPLYLFLILLPILITIGKAGENEALIFITLVIISVLPIVLLIKANERIYPLSIWAISLSIMFLSLIFKRTFNMRFDDIAPIISEAVKIAGIWEPQFPVIHNSLLFPTIFPSIFSILSGIDIAIGTRIISCIIFSLIPVILYVIYKEFFTPNHSFLASCLYAFYPFYLQLTGMTRTGFAFLFVSLFLLLLISKEINLRSKVLMLIIFIFSLIVSHYGVVYMFIFLLIPISALFLYERKFRNFKGKFISYTFIALFITMAFSWYIFTSGAQNFNLGINFGEHIITNIENFFNPEESAAIRAFVTREVTPSFSLEATKWLLFTLLLFIMIGSLMIIYDYIKNKIDPKYAILSIAFSSVLLGITQMGMPRIFGFSLLLTAPLSVLGLSEIIKRIGIRGEKKHLFAFSIFLFILFAFNYGIVANTINTITGEVRDMSLVGTPREKILESDNLDFKRHVYWGWQPESTIKATMWFFVHQDPNKIIFIDSLVTVTHLFTLHLPNEYGGKTVCNLTQPRIGEIREVLEGDVKDGYVFLAYHNIHDNFIAEGNTYYKTSDYQSIFEKMNRVYDSGGAVIYAGK